MVTGVRPRKLPPVPTLDLAAHYQTAHRAGGDYYDFFPLPEDKWGVLIADVSGHGAHPVLPVAAAGAAARLIPYVPAYVERVDLAARRIDVDWQADY